MRGGAALDMSEIERVSALFGVEKIGGAITGSLRGGEVMASDSMGRSGTLDELQELTVADRLQTGGSRRRTDGSRRQRGRRWAQHGGARRSKRGRRGSRFRLNIRATIRLRDRK
jgi:hypothetical protein